MANDFHAADVWSLLAHWAEATPEAPAFLHGDRALSFAELHEQSLRAAQGLSDLGVGPGDRVALWLPNVPAYPILYFACARLGAIAVAVNTRYRAVEVADIVGRSGAKVLACAPGFRGIDFLSILAEIDPAALDALAALVFVGDAPERVPPAVERLRRVPFDRLQSRPRHERQSRQRQSPLQHLHDLGHDQRAEIRTAPPGRDREPCPASSARVRLWRARDAVAGRSAALRRVRFQPGDGDARRRQAHGAGQVLRDRGDCPPDRAPSADHHVRQRRHVCSPARPGAERAAVSLDQVGGLGQLQRLTRGSPQARRSARPPASAASTA